MQTATSLNNQNLDAALAALELERMKRLRMVLKMIVIKNKNLEPELDRLKEKYGENSPMYLGMSNQIANNKNYINYLNVEIERLNKVQG